MQFPRRRPPPHTECGDIASCELCEVDVNGKRPDGQMDNPKTCCCPTTIVGGGIKSTRKTVLYFRRTATLVIIFKEVWIEGYVFQCPVGSDATVCSGVAPLWDEMQTDHNHKQRKAWCNTARRLCFQLLTPPAAETRQRSFVASSTGCGGHGCLYGGRAPCCRVAAAGHPASSGWVRCRPILTNVNLVVRDSRACRVIYTCISASCWPY